MGSGKTGDAFSHRPKGNVGFYEAVGPSTRTKTAGLLAYYMLT